MKRILYVDGTKLGEISEWTQKAEPPTYKTFLGKAVLLTPANDECSFVSPKPVNRRSKLTIVTESGEKLELNILKVIGGTKIQAKLKKA